MRILVKAEAFDTITSDADVVRLREAVGKQIKKIVGSGKLEFGCVTADARMPILVLNVDSVSEVMDLLGNALIDHFKIETHPIMSLDELGDYFAKNPPGR